MRGACTGVEPSLSSVFLMPTLELVPSEPYCDTRIRVRPEPGESFEHVDIVYGVPAGNPNGYAAWVVKADADRVLSSLAAYTAGHGLTQHHHPERVLVDDAKGVLWAFWSTQAGRDTRYVRCGNDDCDERVDIVGSMCPLHRETFEAYLSLLDGAVSADAWDATFAEAVHCGFRSGLAHCSLARPEDQPEPEHYIPDLGPLDETERAASLARYREDAFFVPDAVENAFYCHVRKHHRDQVEGLWARFREVCGDRHDHVREDSKCALQARIWEMHLACTLQDYRHHLERPPGNGPDIKVVLDDGAVVWIEATLATRGTGKDAVAESEPGFTIPNHDKMLMRYTAAVRAKLKQYRKFRTRTCDGEIFVDDAQPYVVAINAALIPHAELHAGVPDIVRSLFGLARHQFTAPVLGARGPVGLRYPLCDELLKQNGAPISTKLFCHGCSRDGSAVLFTPLLPPTMPDLLGRDLIVVHNPYAKAPLPRGVLKFGEEWWREPRDGDLHVMRWSVVEATQT